MAKKYKSLIAKNKKGSFKMYNIKSKYKNPDKYINQLLLKIQDIEKVSDSSRKYYKDLYLDYKGDLVAQLQHNAIFSNIIMARYLGDFKIGDDLIITARIIASSEYLEHGQPKSKIEYNNVNFRKFGHEKVNNG